MDLPTLYASVILVNILAWLTPGPNMVAVMSAAMAGSRRAGLLTGLGLSTGATIWATLAVLGVTVLFELFPDLVRLLRLAGAGYLLWLGLKALSNASSAAQSALLVSAPDQSGRRAYFTGLLVSLSNPKAALFFGSILTAFVPTAATPWLLTSIVLICTVLAVVCHSITATLFSTPLMVGLFSRAKRRITVLFGLIFAGLGLAVAYDTLRRI